MSKQDDTIALLNTIIRLKIKPSPIHGVGVFAMRGIPKGTKLYSEMVPQVFKIPYGSIKKLSPDVREVLLERWPQIVNNSAFAWPTERIVVFMNHSSDCNYDSLNDVTLKDISKDEEVLEDYTKIPNWEIAYPWLVSKVVV